MSGRQGRRRSAGEERAVAVELWFGVVRGDCLLPAIKEVEGGGDQRWAASAAGWVRVGDLSMKEEEGRWRSKGG
jgi:hypothetical protein